jgi:hypothetical protein
LLAFDAEQRGANQPHTDLERAAETRIIDRVTLCVRQNHWLEAQAQAATLYATAQAISDRSLQTFREHGINPAILDRVVADAGPEYLSRLYLEQDTDAERQTVGRAVIRRLLEAHYPVPLENDAELARLGGYFGEALAARSLREHAVAQFNHP